MTADVRVRVGHLRRAQQADPHLVAVGRVAVLAVGQQRHAEAVLGQVGEAVAGHLVARQVVAGRVVRRPLGVPELHLVGRIGGVDGDREQHLEHRVRLAPVGLAVELQPRRAGVQPHDLTHRAVRADRPLDRHLGTQRARAEHRAGRRRRRVGHRLQMERVDVPSVVRRRPVVVELHDVARSGQRLAAGGSLDQGAQRGRRVPARRAAGRSRARSRPRSRSPRRRPAPRRFGRSRTAAPPPRPGRPPPRRGQSRSYSAASPARPRPAPRRSAARHRRSPPRGRGPRPRTPRRCSTRAGCRGTGSAAAAATSSASRSRGCSPPATAQRNSASCSARSPARLPFLTAAWVV